MSIQDPNLMILGRVVSSIVVWGYAEEKTGSQENWGETKEERTKTFCICDSGKFQRSPDISRKGHCNVNFV